MRSLIWGKTFVRAFFLVPKLRLGMHSSQRSVERSPNTKVINSF